ncbi:Gfo/Idh/MocA family protein [Tumebacillus flagellatus]|uniref:Oxidoreductase n=1 Tax=Tumebacillus flagellatus TaxID=1157490 RepID=A0A074LK31_9BACL|nr:Gfo/Idh/MocA family oxidoreductase [Tumebacillus flagellatus]KEO80965.1 hypothetical protein EL26_23335 [Tumebacillus flagellatus]
MMRILRVGIIGTGFGARVHVPMFESHEGFEVVALAGVTARKSPDEIRAATGVDNVYTDWREMIDRENLDVLSIVSAPLEHHEMTLYALQHGVHVLCEKPMGMNAEQTAEMLAARDRSNTLGVLNFEWRFLPARRKVREILASGRLGRLLHVRYEGYRPTLRVLTRNKQGWLSKRESGGGMLGAVGSHMLDSLLWWTDSEVRTLQGELSTYHPEVTVDGEREVRTSDQAFRAIGTLANGATYSVEYASGLRHHKEDWRLQVFGTEGTLVMINDKSVEVALGDDAFETLELPAEKTAPSGMSAEQQRYYTPFITLVERLYDALASDTIDPDLPLFEHGHRVQLVLDAIHKSSDEGCRVTL